MYFGGLCKSVLWISSLDSFTSVSLLTQLSNCCSIVKSNAQEIYVLNLITLVSILDLQKTEAEYMNRALLMCFNGHSGIPQNDGQHVDSD